jgi:hypothetical protein
LPKARQPAATDCLDPVTLKHAGERAAMPLKALRDLVECEKVFRLLWCDWSHRKKARASPPIAAFLQAMRRHGPF